MFKDIEYLQYPIDTTVPRHIYSLLQSFPSSPSYHNPTYFNFRHDSEESKPQDLSIPQPQGLRKHSRRREAGYVPRPRNSFIVFRSWWIDLHKHDNDNPGEAQQNELSKKAALEWKSMTEEKKQPFKTIAAREQLDHKRNHPHYQYAPGPRTTCRRPAKSTPKTASRKSGGTSAISARKPNNVPGPSSSVVSETYTIHMPQISRTAAKVCIHCLEVMAMLPSPPPGHTSAVLEKSAPSQDTSSTENKSEFASSHSTDYLHLDPHFVSDMPPTLAPGDAVVFTSNEWLSSYHPCSNWEESMFSMEWQPFPYTFSNELYHEPEFTEPPTSSSDELIFYDPTLNFPWLQTNYSLDGMSMT